MASPFAQTKWHQNFGQIKKIRRHVRNLRREGVKRNIVVSGYPKSGNTWLTRMLADAAESEMVAYLSDHRKTLPRERGMVGHEMRRDLVTVKSHHTVSLLRMGGIPLTDIVLVVRDPRDVAVSGSGFFFGADNVPTPDSIDRMIDMMVTKNKPYVRWEDQRWDQFVEHSLNRGVPFVRYVDLVHNTKNTLTPILNHLDLNLTDEAVDRVIAYHCFDRANKRYTQTGQTEISRHLRSGKPGDYKKYLSIRQKDRIESEFGPLMKTLGYL
ncbi:MAG: sulfotransferase domain-containing protein [Parvibaculum sp.]|nr:sulfotransferase domain-containing protein [Parvibaculum sp.]